MEESDVSFTQHNPQAAQHAEPNQFDQLVMDSSFDESMKMSKQNTKLQRQHQSSRTSGDMRKKKLPETQQNTAGSNASGNNLKRSKSHETFSQTAKSQ